MLQSRLRCLRSVLQHRLPLRPFQPTRLLPALFLRFHHQPPFQRLLDKLQPLLLQAIPRSRLRCLRSALQHRLPFQPFRQVPFLPLLPRRYLQLFLDNPQGTRLTSVPPLWFREGHPEALRQAPPGLCPQFCSQSAPVDNPGRVPRLTRLQSQVAARFLPCPPSALLSPWAQSRFFPAVNHPRVARPRRLCPWLPAGPGLLQGLALAQSHERFPAAQAGLRGAADQFFPSRRVCHLRPWH